MYCIVQFGMPPTGFKVFQTRPGPAVDITEQLQNGNQWLHPSQDALLTRNGNSLSAAMYKSGISLRADIGFFGNGEYYMNVQVKIPKRYGHRPRGFYGSPDGDQNNELFARGETSPIPPPFRDRRLYPYLLTCKLYSLRPICNISSFQYKPLMSSNHI